MSIQAQRKTPFVLYGLTCPHRFRILTRGLRADAPLSKPLPSLSALHEKEVNAMRCLLYGLVCLCCISQARADQISDWNDLAFRAVYNARLSNFPEIAEIFASLNVALFDAMNAIERQYESYLYREMVRLGSSPEAAITGAAYTVLIRFFPEQSAIFANARDQALAKVTNLTKRSDGFSIGEQAALAILKERAGNRVFHLRVWRPEVTPGSYAPTSLPVSPALSTSKPWLLRTSNQFRPPPPPDIKNATFARDYNETRELGSLTSSIRSIDQTQAGKFWAMSGVHAWNRALTQIVMEKNTHPLEHARVRALLNMALADSFIAAWDAKYHYNFWRPITAIRNGDRTGNPNTPLDLGWVPLIETPLHPEYPSGHSTNLGAALVVLSTFVGSSGIQSIAIVSEESPGVIRRFSSLEQMGEEIASARIWAGIHFRSACEAGRELGREIGEYAVHNVLKPAQSRLDPQSLSATPKGESP